MFAANYQPKCFESTRQHICRAGCYWIEKPTHESMTQHIVLLTPEIALTWLKRNDINRPFSRGNARLLADEMTAGRWKENGESIVFDTDGTLIDGQHRLQAVLNSGREYLVPVVTGIAAAVRPTVDTGRKRTTANNLGMAGESNAATLAAALLLWKGYESRQVQGVSGNTFQKSSVASIMEFLDQWPHMREAVRRAKALLPKGHGRAVIPASEVAVLWYAIVDVGNSPERADEFLSSVLLGHNVAPGNPILALRRRLIDHMRPGMRMAKRERLALALKAWQLWSTGQKRQVLRWEPGQEFPYLS